MPSRRIAAIGFLGLAILLCLGTVVLPLGDPGAQAQEGILGGPVRGGDSGLESEPVPPPALEPLAAPQPTPTWTPIPLPGGLTGGRPAEGPRSLTDRAVTSPAAPSGRTESAIPRPLSPAIDSGPDFDLPTPRLQDLPKPNLLSNSSSGSSQEGVPRGVVLEVQPVGGIYQAAGPQNLNLQAGERLRWKYSVDTEWRILEAYEPTTIRLFDHHYEVGGNFFHGFRHQSYRIQVPSLEEARIRRDPKLKTTVGKERFRLFVEVDASAPKAPRPEGNCLVWQKDRLWLNDLVSGEIDTVIGQDLIDHIEVDAHSPGMIYVLEPPSKVVCYAVKVDFEKEIFAELGRQKGRSDAEISELTMLLQAAADDAQRAWVEGRIAYEQAQGRQAEERRQYYTLYFQGDLDEFNLIRSGHPKPHIQMSQITYRHQNLEIGVGMFSDHLGKILFPVNAFLWINQALPVTGTPFSFEILDKSDPSFIGFDTRVRSDGANLAVEEKAAGTSAWRARDVAIDTYTYASLRPPQPNSPPEYLLDITSDITGGLKRLNQEMIVNARVGTLQLTPNQFRLDLRPELLISPVAMNDLLRNILIGPLDLEGWIKGRRRTIHQLFDKVPMLPDPVGDAFEEAIDELCLRVYEREREQKLKVLNYQFKISTLTLALSRQATPGQFSLMAKAEDPQGQTVQVDRILQSEIDPIDFAANSVAANRNTINFQSFQVMTVDEWKANRPTSPAAQAGQGP